MESPTMLLIIKISKIECSIEFDCSIFFVCEFDSVRVPNTTELNPQIKFDEVVIEFD